MATMRSFTLPYNEQRRLRDRALRRQQADQGEVCGVLVVDRCRRLRLMFVPNLARGPGHFEMSVTAIRSIKKQLNAPAGRVAGFFHSHPVSPATLGPRDVAESPLNALQLVYDVCGRESRLFRVTGTGERRTVKEVPLLIEQRQPHAGKQTRLRRRESSHSDCDSTSCIVTRASIVRITSPGQKRDVVHLLPLAGEPPAP